MKQMLLTIFGLILMWTMGGASGAQSNEPALPEARKPREVKGLGRTTTKAQEIAVRQATLLVRGLLEEYNHTAFKPDEKYVRENLLADEGKPGQDVRNELFDEPFKEWIVTFKDTNWWNDVVRRDHEAQRAQRAEVRQTWAKQLAVALLAVLIAGNGYVRLNRLTRGRFRRGLQVLGVGAAAALLTGVWWYFQG